MISSSRVISRGLFATIAALGTLLAEHSEAHIRITPAGRMGTSDQVKFIQRNLTNPLAAPDSPGPCSTFTTPMATRMQLQPGQNLTFMIQETINHPGRFIVQFRENATQNFWTPGPANQLAVVEDPLNNATTPVTVKVPNVTCDTCMIRVLQQMDEQPGEFYVHCIDVTIGSASVPSSTPPATGTEGKSSTALGPAAKPGFGGCGTISASQGPRGPGGTGLASAMVLSLMLLPLIVALQRRRELRLVTVRPNRNL